MSKVASSAYAGVLLQYSNDCVSCMQVTAITMYATDLVKNQLRKQVAVNENYICYALKTGHLRILSKRHAGHKALIKGLQAPVTDMR